MPISVQLEISDNNECVDAPYWLIIDPMQMMKPAPRSVAQMITGPFFSRESAEKHLAARHYEFSDKAVVWCASGYWSHQYKEAWRTGCKTAVGGE
ncbi:hypothetical protein [Desulfovibrio subterraneus]|uniref:Uncharacterized protein n=1 Tax=Desulfovibrio subterraneus TaxID=2718620 RepID=A0A7J0BLX9_9BACT|nr:hypothetical protein [Desulfovibrio subterraneus]GFM34064.1 hypothetical protein DSM101010T_24290 [Desulfovibrio subterraneus]